MKQATEIHNFKVGDVVKVFRIKIGSGDRYEEGIARIYSILPEEDTYKVKFERCEKFEGRMFVRYVDPNQ